MSFKIFNKMSTVRIGSRKGFFEIENDEIILNSGLSKASLGR